MKFKIPSGKKNLKGMTIRAEEELIELFTKACKMKGSDKTKVITAFMNQLVKEVL